MIDYITNRINKIENNFLRIYFTGLFVMLLFSLVIITLFTVLFIIAIIINFTVKTNNIILKSLFLIIICSFVFTSLGFVIDCEREIKKENYKLKKGLD